MDKRLIDYLHLELGVTQGEIRLASNQVQEPISQLPMSLWQYGLIDLPQLEQIFDWLDTARVMA